MPTIGALGQKRTHQTIAAPVVTVDTLMKAGGKRYESTPTGREDAYTSVIASKGKLYHVLTGFGRPAVVASVKKGAEKANLLAVVENASANKHLVNVPPLTPAQVKNCSRYDVSVAGRADQTRTLFVDKKTNQMFLHVGAVGRGPNHWSKISPSA